MSAEAVKEYQSALDGLIASPVQGSPDDDRSSTGRERRSGDGEEKWEPGEELTLAALPDNNEYRLNGLQTDGGEIQLDSFRADEAGLTQCTDWSSGVDLLPVDQGTSIPTEDCHIKDYFNSLQYMLHEANLPQTKCRTDKPNQTSCPDSITIAVLSSPARCMSILLEGGNQCPGDMMLILSTSWISKRPSERKEGLSCLYVHKAISFKAGGRSYLDHYDPPRRVTYFMNFFTRASTDGERCDGEALEAGLDCPMSSSLRLVQLVDNKLWTRIKLAECGIGYPETLAFAYRSPITYSAKLHSVIVVHLLLKEGVEQLIQDEVERFRNLPEMEFTDKIVVKPSGVMWHASKGVTFHNKSDVESITRAVVELLDQIDEENVILVEAFYDTIRPNNRTSLEWGATENLAIRLRSTVCRSPDNTPVMTKLVAGLSDKSGPVNSMNTVPQGFMSLLLAYGIREEAEQYRLYDVIREGSESMFKSIMDYENSLDTEERGGVGAQTDLIGIDFVLSQGSTGIVPVAIEVNSHNCMVNCQIYEFMNPASRGEAVHPLIQTMIARSQKYIMQGKKILVVGAGGFSKRFIWDAAREYDIEIILVDPEPEDFATTKVSLFIEYDLADHTRDDEHARNICAMVKERKLKIDGCVTLWENCGPLAAAVCEMLHLTGPGLKAARIAARKSWTMDVLSSRTCDIPHWPCTYLYATKSYRISSKKDIADAAVHMSYPAVMKLECGSSNSFLGVRLVEDAPSAYMMYDSIQSDLEKEKLDRRISVDTNTVMMDYMTGTEHDVDVILYKRQLVAAFVTDIGPPKMPRFSRVAAALPSFLPSDKISQLKTAAYQCCVDIGLCNGIFNVKMKMSPVGPKLVEINQRMGDFYLRDWINAAWGIDMLLYLFMISCGVKPVLPSLKLRGHIVGINIQPSVHRATLTKQSTLNLLDLLDIQCAIRINRIEEDIGQPEDDKYDDTYCNIAVMDPDPECAQNRLIEYLTLLRFATAEFDVPYFLKNFKKC